MPKFFVEPEQVKEDEIEILGEDVRHISKVLRLHIGEEILICDGQGYDYQCIINTIEKDYILVQIKRKILSETEPICKVTLFQGLPKADKFELIIQKCTELGILDIYPTLTERVVVKIKDAKKEKDKINRWQKIAKEASKQSNRSIVPTIHDFISFTDILSKLKDFDIILIPYEKQRDTYIQDVLADFSHAKHIGIIIGPEGGFEEKEVQMAMDQGIKPITLGPRILRTETAGLITLGIIMNRMGEI